MKFVIDMNLSPEWCNLLSSAGWEVAHWSSIGSPMALDQEILAWALAEGRIVLTQDLDFGAILAATGTDAPSVVLLRTQNSLPEAIGTQVIAVLQQYQAALEAGALLIVDSHRSRLRILPLRD